MQIPEFRLYGQDDPVVDESIQPKLAPREWRDLDEGEKLIALQQLRNRGWVERASSEILTTITYLNQVFLRECPGKHLHVIVPKYSEYHSGNNSERMEAAHVDFELIFVHGPDALVMRMLSKFTSSCIDGHSIGVARKQQEADERAKWVERAFEKFDRFANCLNHIFEQFAVNQLVTRNGFVPRQDAAITTAVYVPTLAALADPRWKAVSDDLTSAFDDYREGNAPEAITKAHTAVQRFLQILVGEEGKNGRGEVGKLYQEAKQKKLIPVNQFTEPLVNVIKSFIASERATNSTAKPTLTDASPSDALLVLNTVMIFLQFCLQARQ